MNTATYIKQVLVMLAVLAALCVLSCNDNGREQRQKSLDELDAYIKSRKEAADRYAERTWEDLEKEYAEKKAALDKETDKMDRQMKERYDRVQKDWEEYKAEYFEAQKKSVEQTQLALLEKSLKPADITDDGVDAKNIAAVYEHFVKTVNAGSDEYTKEEWKVIQGSWEKLKEKEERISGAISRQDKKRIFDMKAKYTAIKTLNRPFAGNS